MMANRTLALGTLLGAATLVVPACDDRLEQEDALDAADHDSQEAPACDAQPEGHGAVADNTCTPGGDAYYASPYQALIDYPSGQKPLVDVKDAPDGGRYAVGRQVFVSEGGDVRDEHGAVVLSRAPLSETDRTRLMARKDFAQPPIVERPVIGTELSDKLASLAPDDRIPIIGFAEGPPATFVQSERDRAVAYGEVDTVTEAAAVAERVKATKAEQLRQYMAPVLESLDAIGVNVSYVCNNAPCFFFEGTADEVARVAEVAEVTLLEANARGIEETNEINGRGIEEVYQNKPSIDEDFTGQASSVFGQPVAVLEFAGFHDEHPAFREGSGTASRIIERRACDSGGCTTINNLPNPSSSHGTASAGLLFGDLTDGQDSGVSGPVSRRRRSTAAREARGYLYALNGASAVRTQSYLSALDDLPDQNPEPVVVSTSISLTSDPTCAGTDAVSRAADELLFENSIFFNNSAGNSPGTASDCTVSSPGSALGTFTIGAWGDASSNGIYPQWCAARDAPLHPRSSWGGASVSEGRGRTIIDLLGSYDHQKVPVGNSGYGRRTGTSVASPAVASAATVFYDMYGDQVGSEIDDPGYMHAWMLMMGDRDTDTVHIVEEFDRKWGAGRTRMRMLNAEGLDGPSYFASYTTCVDEGETVTFPLNNGSPFAGDYEALRAVAFWYSPYFNEWVSPGDIDLELVGNGSVLRTSASALDNKERVYFKDIGGYNAELRLHGVSIPESLPFPGPQVVYGHPDCGGTGAKVYLAVLAEDLDRDDGNGPSWDPSSCTGVDTW